MVKVREDMTGWKMWEHGVPDSRLIVLKQVEDRIDRTGEHHARWLCECTCEEHNKIITDGASVRHGNTKSCGCLHVEAVKLNGKNSKKNNKYDLTGEYGVLWTSNTNEEVYFDLEDYDKIKDYCWRVYSNNKNYKKIVSTDYNSKKQILLHSLITGYKLCDHINHNTFDNRKSNLRKATQKENARNAKVASNNTSGFTGICWDKNSSKWISYIRVDGRHKTLGYFTNKEDAVQARLEAEAKYFGEFAPQQYLFEQYKININMGEIN